MKTIFELAQIYQVHPNLISLWKKEFLSNAGKVFETGKKDSDQIQRLKKENDELVHQIGQLTVDINWLKKRFFDTEGCTKETGRYKRDCHEYLQAM